MLIDTPDRQCEQVAKHCHPHAAVSTQLTSPPCFVLNTLLKKDLLQPDELKQNPPDIKDEHSFFGALHRVRDGNAQRTHVAPHTSGVAGFWLRMGKSRLMLEI